MKRFFILRLECDTKEIDANIKLAEALGITGTPTLVLPDGRTHTGGNHSLYLPHPESDIMLYLMDQ